MKKHSEPLESLEMKFKCPECHKAFINTRRLEEHKRVHSDYKLFSCPQCPKSFKHKASLEGHLNSHRGIKPFTCSVCSKCFNGRPGLSQHKRRHTELNTKERCNICDKQLTSKSCLRQHINVTHSDIRNVDCLKCNKKFKTKYNLIRHQANIHDGQGPQFSCNLCPNIYRDRKGLSRHLMVHSQERKFTCITCKVLFITQAELRVHFKSKKHNANIVLKENMTIVE